MSPVYQQSFFVGFLIREWGGELSISGSCSKSHSASMSIIGTEVCAGEDATACDFYTVPVVVKPCII